MDYAGKMSQKNLTEKEKKAFIIIKKIEKEMKEAMKAHTQLLKDAAALTGEYEVNYLLNQEIMEDNRLKVVVKNIRTEEDLEQMNFKVLQQISLFN